MSNPSAEYPTSTLVMASALVVVLVGGFVGLSLSGRDTSTYTLFVAGPLVTSVVGAVLSKRVGKVESIARNVQRQTNGQLSQKIAEVHSHLDLQTSEIVEEVRQIAPPNPPQGAARATHPARALPAARQAADSDAQVLGPIKPSTFRP